MPPVTLVDQRHQQIVICQRPSDQNWDAANKECEPEDNRNIESPGEAESDRPLNIQYEVTRSTASRASPSSSQARRDAWEASAR